MTDTHTEATCAELVQAHLESRMDQVRRLLEAVNHPEACPNGNDFEANFGYDPKDARRAALEMPLGAWRSDELHRYILQLSTGGPGDQFEFIEHRAKYYRYLDWFDGAVIALTPQQSRDVTNLWGDMVNASYRKGGDCADARDCAPELYR